MKRTLLVATAATIAGGVTAFSIASYASSEEKPPASSAGDAYTAAALDLADTSSAPGPPSPPSPPGPPAAPGAPNKPGTGKGGQGEFEHGEAVVKDKDGKQITVDRQRGSVTAVSATSLTVKSADGTSWTWVIDKDTKVRGPNLKAEPVSDVKVGNTVAVGGQRSGDTRTARAVIDPPPTRKDLRGDLRKLRHDLRILRRY